MLDHQLLRMALAHFAGQVITPQIASEIEAIATHRADRSYDPSRFGVRAVGNYVIRVERFRDIVDEMHLLHLQHWGETEKHRAGLPLMGDYAELKRRERDAALLQFTVRQGTELVGNLRMYLGISLHTSTLFAEEDTLYIKPEHRTGWLGIHLLRFAEASLRSIGVREIRADSKVVNNADVLMRRLRYTHFANKFVKVFDDEEDTCALTHQIPAA